MLCQLCKKEEHKIKTKPFKISKKAFWKAYQRVKSSGGGPGIDSVTLKEFESNLENNLYKIWNRMCSGSYFPPPVQMVEIPKSDGGRRVLGIPTVSDRVAQMVVKEHIEPKLDPCFHKDSYGYRPGKSAVQAVGEARKRCWTYDWVIDMDIKGFFDSIDHDLMMMAVEKHTKEKWVLLYVERWLNASIQTLSGEVASRNRGTPQGGVISPLLANLFLHYAFDKWLEREFPDLPFERYADDAIVHCVTEKQAKYVLKMIRGRMEECGLTLHPEKTKIVYCKDDNRKGDHENRQFDYLSFTFRPRLSKNKNGQLFVGFTPAVSTKSLKSMRFTVRSWKLNKRTPLSLEEIAEKINPVIRGWINYYGTYCKSALSPIFEYLNQTLALWAKRKFKKLHRKFLKALNWVKAYSLRNPGLFAHWKSI